jgi:MFS family permease
MTLASQDSSNPDIVPHKISPTALPLAARLRIFAYLGALTCVLGFGDPNEGLLNLPVSFLLKNKLQMEAHDMANFRAIAGLPLYLAFLFGFIRDNWHPWGMRDRGYMICFGFLGAALGLAWAFAPLSAWSLMLAVLALTTAFLFAAAAQNGLSTTLAQQHVMSGRVSAVWSIFSMLPVVASLLLGGYFSDFLESGDPVLAQRIMFFSGAAVLAGVALFALWRPSVVYDNVHHEDAPVHHPLAEMKRLSRYWPVYPALIIWLLWNFNPGSATPLQYHLQNHFQATDGQWGEWNAIYWGSYIPTFILYGLLCRRFPLKKLLIVSTFIAIPQFAPLLFIGSMQDALWAAAPIGLMGGLANAAYLDLLIRSCPPGLQGTVLMMSTSLYYVATRGGDVLGAYLYDATGDFTICVALTMIVYTLILPVILLAPRDLVATADGEMAAPDDSALSLTPGKG